jgi:hypothetical protein
MPPPSRSGACGSRAHGTSIIVACPSASPLQFLTDEGFIMQSRGPSLFVDAMAPKRERIGRACEYRRRVPDGSARACERRCLRLRTGRMAFFSAPLADRMTQLYSVILALTQRFELKVGQAYSVNDRRWLHGRDSFKGNREMWRYLVNWSSPIGTNRFHGRVLVTFASERC